MRKRLIRLALCLMLVLPLVTVTARADCAPKPTTSVTVLEPNGRQIIVTLLGDRKQYGPNGVVTAEDAIPGDLTDAEQAAWAAFRDYVDPEGFCFWGQMDWYGMDWRYYPPETFKIAVYYPNEEVLLVSEQSYERYAFHSDFRMVLPALGESTQSGTVDLVLKKDMDWMEEAAGFLGRVILTLAVELALALLFGYRGKEAVKTILLVNLVTQVGLNVLLSLWYIFDGPFYAMLRLAVGEIVVLLVEAVIYRRRLEGKGKATWYAIAANLASVWVGWMLID